jgi:hypothetical protein
VILAISISLQHCLLNILVAGRTRTPYLMLILQKMMLVMILLMMIQETVDEVDGSAGDVDYGWNGF